MHLKLTFKAFTNRTIPNCFFVETIAPNALDLFLSLCKGKHKRDQGVLSALGHLLISLSFAGGCTSNKKSPLEGSHFVRPRCFWACELILSYCVDDWCFHSESTGAPVKCLRVSDIGTMITLAPLVLLWVGLMLQYVPCQNVTMQCTISGKPARFLFL